MNRYNSQWNAEREAKLKDLGAQYVPHSTIAAQFGTTRSAVSRKLYRLGVSTARSTAWTPEREARLTVLLSRNLSASQIADDLGAGITRAGVIGKVRRLGLELPNSRGVHKAPSAPRPSRKPREHTAAPEPKPKPPRGRSSPAEIARRRDEAASLRAKFSCTEIVDLTPGQSATAVDFMGLTKDTCRWPIGDPRSLNTIKFCGARPAPDKPYCARHWCMGHQ